MINDLLRYHMSIPDISKSTEKRTTIFLSVFSLDQAIQAFHFLDSKNGYPSQLLNSPYVRYTSGI